MSINADEGSSDSSGIINLVSSDSEGDDYDYQKHLNPMTEYLTKDQEKQYVPLAKDSVESNKL